MLVGMSQYCPACNVRIAESQRQCPQCGAAVEIPDRGGSVNCSYCDVAIRVEGRAEEKGKPGRKPWVLPEV